MAVQTITNANFPILRHFPKTTGTTWRMKTIISMIKILFNIEQFLITEDDVLARAIRNPFSKQLTTLKPLFIVTSEWSYISVIV